jgi:uncharacterized coiled-coil protein SlyX
MKIATEHLERAIADLEARRAALDEAIATLRAMLAERKAGTAGPRSTSGTIECGRRGP